MTVKRVIECIQLTMILHGVCSGANPTGNIVFLRYTDVCTSRVFTYGKLYYLRSSALSHGKIINCLCVIHEFSADAD